jgi:hypothetical protein
MKVKFEGWETINDLPYRIDLAPSDFHLFEPMKVYLGKQKYKTEDELKRGVLNRVRSQD